MERPTAPPIDSGDRNTPSRTSVLADLLTVDDVAAWLRVKKSWVYIQVEREQIPFLRVGRYLRFRPDDLEAYLRAKQRGVEVR